MINQLSYVKESYLEDPSHINYILDHLSGMLQVPPDFGRSEGATLLLAPVPPPPPPDFLYFATCLIYSI